MGSTLGGCCCGECIIEEAYWYFDDPEVLTQGPVLPSGTTMNWPVPQGDWTIALDIPISVGESIAYQLSGVTVSIAATEAACWTTGQGRIYATIDGTAFCLHDDVFGSSYLAVFCQRDGVLVAGVQNKNDGSINYYRSFSPVSPGDLLTATGSFTGGSKLTSAILTRGNVADCVICPTVDYYGDEGDCSPDYVECSSYPDENGDSRFLAQGVEAIAYYEQTGNPATATYSDPPVTQDYGGGLIIELITTYTVTNHDNTNFVVSGTNVGTCAADFDSNGCPVLFGGAFYESTITVTVERVYRNVSTNATTTNTNVITAAFGVKVADNYTIAYKYPSFWDVDPSDQSDFDTAMSRVDLSGGTSRQWVEQ